MKSKNIALFASGKGSNALNIISYFQENVHVNISFILTNNINAEIIESAKKVGVKVITCSNQDVENSNYLIDICEINHISCIVLAGFLRKIPTEFIDFFPHKIINIHPALLPKYGGEGMYGMHIHKAVLENKDVETGVTIHFVNSEYDKGEIIAQFSCQLNEKETIETIQEKIQVLEKKHFPEVIEKIIDR